MSDIPYDDRLIRLIEHVFCNAEGKRLATHTAWRIATEIWSDGYRRVEADARLKEEAAP